MSFDIQPFLVQLAIVLVAATMLLLALALRFRRRALEQEVPMPLALAVAITLIGLVASLVAGAVVGYLVMFGPSHITGDFVGLPWYTMLPALGAALWVMAKVNRNVVGSLLSRVTSTAVHRE